MDTPTLYVSKYVKVLIASHLNSEQFFKDVGVLYLTEVFQLKLSQRVFYSVIYWYYLWFFGPYTSPTSMSDQHTKRKAQNSKYWQTNCDVMAGKLVTYHTGTPPAS